MQHKNFESDLWQAWRYVAGEMEEPQRREYEELLAIDQAAREAVAEAVDLEQLVRAAESESLVASSTQQVESPGRLRRWTRRAAWVVTGAAASLLAVTAINAWRSAAPVPRPATDLSAADSAVRSELALLWSETRTAWPDREEQISPPPDAFDWQAPSPGSPLDAEQDGLAAMTVEGDDGSVPDWMLQALELSREGEMPGEATDEGDI